MNETIITAVVHSGMISLAKVHQSSSEWPPLTEHWPARSPHTVKQPTPKTLIHLESHIIVACIYLGKLKWGWWWRCSSAHYVVSILDLPSQTCENELIMYKMRVFLVPPLLLWCLYFVFQLVPRVAASWQITLLPVFVGLSDVWAGDSLAMWAPGIPSRAREKGGNEERASVTVQDWGDVGLGRQGVGRVRWCGARNTGWALRAKGPCLVDYSRLSGCWLWMCKPKTVWAVWVWKQLLK